MLKPRKRISKKKLKEDKLVTFYFKAVDKLEQNTNIVLGAAAAILIIVVGIAYYIYSNTKAEQLASVELSKATRIYEIGDYQNAIAQLSNVTDNYGSTPSGKIARFYLAKAFYQTEDYINAEKNYRRFLSGFSGDEHFLAAAQGGLAATLLQRQQYSEAAAAFIKAAEKYDSVLAPGFLIQAGRCFTLANNESRARKVYSEIVEKYPQSPEKDEAIMLSSMLEK
ncbi:tetratricopeptide repeat protein [candidate division KSB1 bacterium]|nr:tetratricopeptide repeat protein [candidate division KSB1 bacterium]